MNVEANLTVGIRCGAPIIGTRGLPETEPDTPHVLKADETTTTSLPTYGIGPALPLPGDRHQSLSVPFVPRHHPLFFSFLLSTSPQILHHRMRTQLPRRR